MQIILQKSRNHLNAVGARKVTVCSALRTVNVRRHGTRFRCLGDLEPRICASLMINLYKYCWKYEFIGVFNCEVGVRAALRNKEA
jgi:hypothetical protein